MVGINKLLCNNKDAEEQRDLDTAAMRSMVLAALEKRKEEASSAQANGSNGGGKSKSLQMEEAIQIAETIQGLAETLTALQQEEGGEGAQLLDEQLQQSLQKVASSLESTSNNTHGLNGNSSDSMNLAVQQSLQQASHSLQKSKAGLHHNYYNSHYPTTFLVAKDDGSTPRWGNLSAEATANTHHYATDPTPRRSNVSAAAVAKQQARAASNGHQLRQRDHASIPLQSRTAATNNHARRGTQHRTSSQRHLRKASHHFQGGSRGGGSKPSPNDRDNNDKPISKSMQQTALTAATGLSGVSLQETLTNAIASLTFTGVTGAKKADSNPPSPQVVRRREPTKTTMATQRHSVVEHHRNLREWQTPKQQQPQQDSIFRNRGDVGYRSPFLPAGDDDRKISAPPPPPPQASEQPQELPQPQQPKKQTARDTSRGGLWSRMVGRGGGGGGGKEPEEQSPEKKGKSVERWTISSSRGDKGKLIMSNGNDSMAEPEGKTPRNRSSSSITAGLSSMSSTQSEDALLQRISCVSSEDRKTSKCRPDKKEAAVTAATSKKKGRAMSVQTRQREAAAFDPPMSALSQSSGFLMSSQDDIGHKYPVRYQTVKSDDEKGFEIFLDDKNNQASASRYTRDKLRERAELASHRLRRQSEQPQKSSFGRDPVILSRASSVNVRARAVLNNLDGPSPLLYRPPMPPKAKPTLEDIVGMQTGTTAHSSSDNTTHSTNASSVSRSRALIRE